MLFIAYPTDGKTIDTAANRSAGFVASNENSPSLNYTITGNVDKLEKNEVRGNRKFILKVFKWSTLEQLSFGRILQRSLKCDSFKT